MLVKFLDTRAPVPGQHTHTDTLHEVLNDLSWSNAKLCVKDILFSPILDDLSTPLKSSDPFFNLVVLFSELIRLNVFSYKMYLSTLIARGDVKCPIIPSLPFARDQEPDDDSAQLSLPISLPVSKKPRLDNGASSLDAAQSTLGPVSSPPSPTFSFTTAMEDLISDRDTVVFQHGGGVGRGGGDSSTGGGSGLDEDTARLRYRQLTLLASDHDSSQLGSSLGFSSPVHDSGAPNSPVLQTKSDSFNFSLSFPPTASLFQDEDQHIDITVNKHASRHLLFAAFFPICDSHLSTQEQNERAVVLCGVGKPRNKVEKIIRKITEDMEHYFRLISVISSPVLPESKLQDLLQRFRSLPTFEQCMLATSFEKTLRASIGHRAQTPGTPSGTTTTAAAAAAAKFYPGCAQLVFVCELLEICGSVHQLIELLVDVLSCDAEEIKEPASSSSSSSSSLGRMAPPSPPPPLPVNLCQPVVSLLHKYLPCLFLSQQNTSVAFEG